VEYWCGKRTSTRTVSKVGLGFVKRHGGNRMPFIYSDSPPFAGFCEANIIMIIGLLNVNEPSPGGSGIQDTLSLEINQRQL